MTVSRLEQVQSRRGHAEAQKPMRVWQVHGTRTLLPWRCDAAPLTDREKTGSPPSVSTKVTDGERSTPLSGVEGASRAGGGALGSLRSALSPSSPSDVREGA